MWSRTLPAVPVVVVVPAAGRGTRLGPGAPKALRLLAGEPMLLHALRSLIAAPSVRDVVVVAPADEVDAVLAACRPVVGPALRVVAGGGDRRASVAAGLAALSSDIDLVLVSDAARPFVPVSLTEAVVAAVRGGAPAAVPGLPLADTVKQVDDQGWVVATPPRAALRAVQTPQGFERGVLERAHAEVPVELGGVTDDAGLVEALGLPVLVVPGSPDAFKVTRPEDLERAEQVLALRAAAWLGGGA